MSNSTSKTAANNLYLDKGHLVFVEMFSSTCLFHGFQWAFAVAIEIKWVIVLLSCDYIFEILLFLCAEIRIFFSSSLQGPFSSVNRQNCLDICCAFSPSHLEPRLRLVRRLVFWGQLDFNIKRPSNVLCPLLSRSPTACVSGHIKKTPIFSLCLSLEQPTITGYQTTWKFVV